MKNALIILLFIIPITNATIRTVDNNTGAAWAQYTSLPAAITAAAAGDTIYVSGSPYSYGDITLNKQLVLIGQGYFLTENPNVTAYRYSALVGAVVITASGCKIMGMELTPGNNIKVQASNTTILRNYFSSGSIHTEEITGELTDIMIRQNYLAGHIMIGYYALAVNNVTIEGNYIAGNITEFYSVAGINNNMLVKNNVIGGRIGTSDELFQNNIFTEAGSMFWGPGNTIQYCMAANNELPAGNGNINNVNMTTVFVGQPAGTFDGQWKLKTGSPAIGTGQGGVDMGMYAGNYPYQLSGLAPVPVIYLMNVAPAGNTSSGIPVQVKIKSNN